MPCVPDCEQKDILYDQELDALYCDVCGNVKRVFIGGGRSRKVNGLTRAQLVAHQTEQEVAEETLRQTLLRLSSKWEDPQ
jgi:hypothetical protein